MNSIKISVICIMFFMIFLNYIGFLIMIEIFNNKIKNFEGLNQSTKNLKTLQENNESV